MQSEATNNLAFNPEALRKIATIVAKYEKKRSALMPVMYLAQDEFGALTSPVLELIAKTLEIPPVWVFEAVSFYSMYKRKDMGKFCLQICDNITCHMMGSGKLVKNVQDKLKISHDQVTTDNYFSLRVVQCLGACDKAPVMQLNDEYIENVTIEKLDQTIRKCRGEGAR